MREKLKTPLKFVGVLVLGVLMAVLGANIWVAYQQHAYEHAYVRQAIQENYQRQQVEKKAQEAAEGSH